MQDADYFPLRTGWHLWFTSICRVIFFSYFYIPPWKNSRLFQMSKIPQLFQASPIFQAGRHPDMSLPWHVITDAGHLVTLLQAQEGIFQSQYRCQKAHFTAVFKTIWKENMNDATAHWLHATPRFLRWQTPLHEPSWTPAKMKQQQQWPTTTKKTRWITQKNNNVRITNVCENRKRFLSPYVLGKGRFPWTRSCTNETDSKVHCSNVSRTWEESKNT